MQQKIRETIAEVVDGKLGEMRAEIEVKFDSLKDQVDEMKTKIHT